MENIFTPEEIKLAQMIADEKIDQIVDKYSLETIDTQISLCNKLGVKSDAAMVYKMFKLNLIK